jgi:HEAT repeat protein
VLRDLLKDQNADVRVAAATAILELGKAPQNRGA